MCGIAGAVECARTSSHEVLVDRGTAMADALAHRGPDDAGVWTDPERGVVLAHRRLAIIDLTPGGHQPMVSRSGRFVLVFNGEIYNYLDLRRDLQARGSRFSSTSDTEVLLESIAVDGLQPTLERVRGMFALALHDRERGALVLARDRLGEKPLYYGWAGTTLLFGSECSALRAHPDLRPEVDRDAVAALLRYSYIPAPHSIYCGIRKLTPGCVLEVALDRPGHLPEPRPYWSMREIAESGRRNLLVGSAEQAADALDGVLRDAVRSCMVSDVPLGAFLSGGIDSSTVVAMMQAQSSRPVRTYTVGFGEAGYDESGHARAVARHLGTEHTELHVASAQAQDVIPDLASMYDEPFADSSQIPTALISRLARRHVTVALSGDGGDELFGGYGRYIAHRNRWRGLARVPLGTRRVAARLLRAVPEPSWGALGASLERLGSHAGRGRQLGARVHNGARLLAMEGTEDVYRAILSHWHDPAAVVLGSREAPDVLTTPREWASLEDPTDRVMYLDTLHYLPDAILAKVDRAAMATSLETRVPLLDPRVVELAWRLPPQFRLPEGHGGGKWLLRQVLHRYVPRPLVERPKMGFGVPIDAWLRGPLRAWAEDLLTPDRLREQGLLDADAVQRMWRQHLTGALASSDALWSLLMLQTWHDRWLTPQPAA